MGRRFTRWVLLFVFVMASALACGGGQESADKPKVDEEDSEPVDAKGKKWGGWRWKGKRNDCFFVFKNECFATRKKACKRAGCAEKTCEHNESAPAKVSCKKS